jgi:hypothetical protein
VGLNGRSAVLEARTGAEIPGGALFGSFWFGCSLGEDRGRVTALVTVLAESGVREEGNKAKGVSEPGGSDWRW